MPETMVSKRRTLGTAGRRRSKALRPLLALAASLAVHGLLAVAIAVCLAVEPGTEALATLDPAHVELSFAEVEAEAAPAVAPPPALSATPRPKATARPPDPAVERREPSVPAAMRFGEPSEDPPRVDAPPPAAAPRQAKIDAPPRPTRSIRPNYPRGARRRGEQGEVELEIRVNAGGDVDDVRVVESCGFAELDEAAVRAARGATFSPAKAGGEPVASTARLRLAFRLR